MKREFGSSQNMRVLVLGQLITLAWMRGGLYCGRVMDLLWLKSLNSIILALFFFYRTWSGAVHIGDAVVQNLPDLMILTTDWVASGIQYLMALEFKEYGFWAVASTNEACWLNSLDRCRIDHELNWGSLRWALIFNDLLFGPLGTLHI